MSGFGPPQLVIAALLVTGVLVAWVVHRARRLDLTGYGFGGDVVVRCQDGHLFTTIWVPLMSFKAVRLGFVRFQRCPVADHLTFVVPVRPADLTESQRRMAARYHDRRIP
jgi:hypothetical protein